ncbi:hypothetical protein RE628_06020 [Paenibacillus sp. D2_2]|uniref:hypothetical protein n=1 Tax=Paenibacillus sp. D2_2 TaxID=3073092 RepID=UPI0028162725|nr:hypothetical protein [Paenibacillus sp. D2_2]WMT41994.1 hypothetical protein RE628_06020 [Paenibacillus sp. D2_2]
MIPLSKIALGLGVCVLLLLPSSEAALGADNTTSAATNVSSNILPKKGDSLVAQQRVPLFPKQISSKSDIHQFNAPFQGQQGDMFTVREVKGELIQVHSFNLGDVWTPLWYWKKEAGQIVQLKDAELVNLTSKAKLALAPNSSITWNNKVAGDSNWVAVARWNNWVGYLRIQSRGRRTEKSINQFCCGFRSRI